MTSSLDQLHDLPLRLYVSLYAALGLAESSMTGRHLPPTWFKPGATIEPLEGSKTSAE